MTTRAQTGGEERLTILVRSGVSRGKAAAAAVHAALLHYGIDHGAVIVLGANGGQIEAECTPETVCRDAGRTEVAPGTVTAGVRKRQDTLSDALYGPQSCETTLPGVSGTPQDSGPSQDGAQE